MGTIRFVGGPFDGLEVSCRKIKAAGWTRAWIEEFAPGCYANVWGGRQGINVFIPSPNQDLSDYPYKPPVGIRGNVYLYRPRQRATPYHGGTFEIDISFATDG